MYLYLKVVINKKNPYNVYFTDFDNTFVNKIHPEQRFKNPEFRENPEHFHI